MEQFISFIANNMFMFDLLSVSLCSLIKFEKRKFWYITMPILAVCCVVLSYYSVQLITLILSPSIFRTFLSYAAQFLLLILAMLCIYRMNFAKSIFVATYAYFIQHLTFCFDRVVRGELKIDNIMVIVTHFLILLAFVISFWVLYFHRINSQGMDKINLWQASIVSAVLLIVCIYLNSHSQEAGEDSNSYRLAIIFCCLCGILLQFCMYSVSYTKISKQQLQQLYDEKAKQFEISKENISIINVKVHDLKHLINEYHASGKIDNDSLKDMKEVIDTYDARINTTHNQALDTVLTEKSLLCKKKGITFTALCEGKNIGFINPTDLYIFFANAIDNAMEATERIDDPNYKVISITAHQKEQMYYICLRNYYKEEPKFDNRGQLITTKSDKASHGFGSKSMEMFINKYNGEIDFNKANGVFSLNAVIPLSTNEKGIEIKQHKFNFKKWAKEIWLKFLEEFK